MQVDADGQHDAAEIEQLLAVPDADVVIGSRFAGRGDYAVRGPRRWAMRLLSRTLTGIVGTAVTDPTSGFRLVHRRALALFAEHYPEEYLGDTVEALVVAHRAGLTITQVPVAMRGALRGGPAPTRCARRSTCCGWSWPSGWPWSGGRPR